MTTLPPLLDAGVVTRCRRRVHLEHDPDAVRPPARPDPAADMRVADAEAHRKQIGELLAGRLGADWVTVADGPVEERERDTVAAMRAGAGYVYNALLPTDAAGGRRGSMNLLVRTDDGYLPVLVVRHRVTDQGEGARTSPLSNPSYRASGTDPRRKPRAHARDQMRLAHAWRQLEAGGFAAPGPARGGVIGLDADVLLWHELEVPTWPGQRTALSEYDRRFADRQAVATAAANAEPALAEPSRVLECRRCPWWPVCSVRLADERDVSLVVRGEEAELLRAADLRTVDALAAADSAALPPGVPGDAAVLARAWLADQTVVRRVREVAVTRADVEVDVDMESFADAGAYLWGTLLSGADIGLAQGYRPFVTWEPLPTDDEARSFGEFWAWLADVRERCAARELSFGAYCYNELAENRWLLASVDRFAGATGVPDREQVQRFIDSEQWIDLYRGVAEQFVCARGKGLKVIAPVAGFSWRDADAGGENSMRWYRAAVGMDGDPPDPAQRERLLRYNEDDVRATYALRQWMSGPAADLPHQDDLKRPS